MVENDQADQALNAVEAAEFLGAHVESIRRLARRGEIPSYKVGKDWRFRRAALERWVAEHHVRLKPPVLMVVDDEEAIRQLVKLTLEARGYKVATFARGKDALAALEEVDPALLVLDLSMPEMNGATVLAEVRKRLPALPVIILTAYPESEVMDQALAHGPFTLLRKPVRGGVLADTIEQLLSGGRTAQGRKNAVAGEL